MRSLVSAPASWRGPGPSVAAGLETRTEQRRNKADRLTLTGRVIGDRGGTIPLRAERAEAHNGLLDDVRDRPHGVKTGHRSGP